MCGGGDKDTVELKEKFIWRDSGNISTGKNRAAAIFGEYLNCFFTFKKKSC